MMVVNKLGGQNIRAGERIGGTDGRTLADDPTTVKKDARNAAPRSMRRRRALPLRLNALLTAHRSGRDPSKGRDLWNPVPEDMLGGKSSTEK
ncbi:hypothetical protein M8J77_017744 [Diaphorina citri]|nr:hypothetical protein M8J77_017744 [Diaphorina citri]